MKKLFMLKKSSIILCFICTIVIMSIGLFTYFTVKKESIKVNVKGEEIIVDSYSKTVKDILKENNITYDEDDIIKPNLDTKLYDYMNINVINVKKVTISEHERIQFDTKTINDKNLAKGIKIVTQEGKDGRKLVTYETVYHNGKLSYKDIKKVVVKEEAVNEVVTKGTSSINNSNLSLNKSNSKVNGRKITVSATAYSGGGITATGTRARWGTIAVDPRIIPYGTKVYIPQFNMTFIAEDCGGGIKGNKIDIYMNSNSQCFNWGVRTIDVYVVG